MIKPLMFASSGNGGESEIKWFSFGRCCLLNYFADQMVTRLSKKPQKLLSAYLDISMYESSESNIHSYIFNTQSHKSLLLCSNKGFLIN